MKTKLILFSILICFSTFAETTFHAKLKISNPMDQRNDTIFSIIRTYTNSSEYFNTSPYFGVGLDWMNDPILKIYEDLEYRSYLEFKLKHYTKISNSTFHFKAISQLRSDYTSNPNIFIVGLDSCYLTPVGTKAAFDRLGVAGQALLNKLTSPNDEVNLTGSNQLDTYLNKALSVGKVGFGIHYGSNGAQGLIFSTSPRDLYLEFDYTIGKPNTPTGLRASSSRITSTGCELTWNESSDIVQGYKIYVYKNGSIVNTINDVTTNPFDYVTFDNLDPATAYTFTVSAYNEAGESAQSTPLNVVTKPLPPTNLSIPASCSSISLSWLAPAGQILGYNIYKNNVLLTTTTNLNVQINGLTINTPYTFSVKSYNQSGESASANINITASASPDTPHLADFMDLISPTGVYTFYWFSVSTAVGYKIYELSPESKLIATTVGPKSYYELGKASSLPSGVSVWGISSYNASGCESGIVTTGFYIPPTLSRSKSLNSLNESIEISPSEITFYPNPVIDKLFITGTTEPFDAVIMNLQGQVIKSAVKLSGYIDFSDFKSGIYLVKMKYKGNEVIHRIIKQ